MYFSSHKPMYILPIYNLITSISHSFSNWIDSVSALCPILSSLTIQHNNLHNSNGFSDSIFYISNLNCNFLFFFFFLLFFFFFFFFGHWLLYEFLLAMASKDSEFKEYLFVGEWDFYLYHYIKGFPYLSFSFLWL